MLFYKLFRYSPFFVTILLSGSEQIKMNNELLKLFDIPDDVVEELLIDNKDSFYEISIRVKSSRTCCPRCNSIHLVRKGNRKRSLVSVPVNDRPVRIVTHAKRYRCNDCQCSFEDINPAAYGDWSFTRTAVISLLDKLKPYNATNASVARSFGVSSTRIMEISDAFVRVKKHRLPRVLLIDEFHFSRNSRYQYHATDMNFENSLMIDIIESRTHDVLSDCLFRIDQKEKRSNISVLT